jgi:hypothetical protein
MKSVQCRKTLISWLIGEKFAGGICVFRPASFPTRRVGTKRAQLPARIYYPAKLR